MAGDATKVDVGLTGAVSKAPTGTAAPTSATVALNAAFTDGGFISEDGISISLPGSGDTTPIKVWQGGATVRTLRTASEDLPTFTFTFLETNKTTVETYFDTTVTQSSTEGTFDYTVKLPTPFALAVDILDGPKSKRYHVPRAVRAEVGDLVYQNNEPVGYEVTIEAEYDATAGYNFRGWDTSLKTPA